MTIPPCSPRGASPIQPPSDPDASWSKGVHKELSTSFNASFSSFQPSSNSSTTQRIYKDSKLVAVKDSDDDEDDNSSMESLSDLFARTKQKTAFVSSGSLGNRVHPRNDEQEGERRRLLGMYTGGARHLPLFRRDELKAYLVRSQSAKPDLSILKDIDDHEEDTRVAKADEELAQSLKELDEMKQTAIDKKLLASILQSDLPRNEGDDDRLARIMNAVDRTEALAGEHVFSFFGLRGIKSSASKDQKDLPFPNTTMSAHLQDKEARDEYYLSGFMTEQAGLKALDDEYVRWTYRAYMQESSNELRQAYLNMISASSPRWTRSGLTAQNVQSSFEALGACAEVLRDGEGVQRRAMPKREHLIHEYDELTAILRLYHVLCEDMDFSTLSKLSSLIVRLSLDDEVMSDVDVCSTAAALLEKLANLSNAESRRHVHERIEAELLTCITDASLQAQFFHHFVPTSQYGVELRVALARKIILEHSTSDDASKQDSQDLDKNLARPEDSHPLAVLTDHIATSRTWQTHNSYQPDYTGLKALTFILDIAIADGQPDLLLPHDPSSPRRTHSDREKLFNEFVDDLADLLHDRASQIQDSGASHLSRSILKDAIQALHGRLIYSVRTRKKRRRHVFDADGQMDITALLANGGGTGSERVKTLKDEKGESDGAQAETKTEAGCGERTSGPGFVARYRARKMREGGHGTAGVEETAEQVN